MLEFIKQILQAVLNGLGQAAIEKMIELADEGLAWLKEWFFGDDGGLTVVA